MEQTDKKVIQS